MKNIIAITILLILTSSAHAQIWPFKKKAVPSPTPVPVKVERSNAPIQDAKKIVHELKAELNVAKSENVKLKNSLEKANANVKEGFVQITKLEKDIKALKEWGVVQQAEAQKWLEKYTKAIKRYHRLKWIAAIIAAAGGVLLGLRFMSLVPPPYNLLVPIGGAGLFGTLIWIFL
jgi:hypothetical protein